MVGSVQRVGGVGAGLRRSQDAVLVAALRPVGARAG
ncbi:hypothetical protein Ae168Ps1_1730c [Pseudonocardia sp. Ae168_Ps1]|nr:hypothetical protein Ae150APs1_1725c [Pseudonocardia sp. Ae150A_Ps1]OLL79324.1 hypothetical protein Ae168Ps1_1730c [Pseudonocardia sp. Ae168_Ps1]OLL86538.1 hypothetical protein Ae263Ps1_3593 [Pseudonocardia sp. Ae263_Ps1]OLL93414.1 hypothetical protein Ae356Ps1_3311c [Pseudonocardia sp. Ae356_Ps1]